MSIVHISKSISYNEIDTPFIPAGWHFSIHEIHSTMRGEFFINSTTGPFETADRANEACKAEIKKRERDDKLDNLPQWKRVELLELAAVSGLFGEEPL